MSFRGGACKRRLSKVRGACVPRAYGAHKYSGKKEIKIWGGRACSRLRCSSSETRRHCDFCHEQAGRCAKPSTRAGRNSYDFATRSCRQRNLEARRLLFGPAVRQPRLRMRGWTSQLHAPPAQSKTSQKAGPHPKGTTRDVLPSED